MDQSCQLPLALLRYAVSAMLRFGLPGQAFSVPFHELTIERGIQPSERRYDISFQSRYGITAYDDLPAKCLG